MKEIQLTRGYVAIVDDEDYDSVAAHKWWALIGKKRSNGSTPVYATRAGGNSLHRFIMDAKQGQIIDHINGNGPDNRRRNLRYCTQAENNRNSCKPFVNKNGGRVTSRYKGVVWHNNICKWQAKINCNGVEKIIGNFDSAINAATAYNIWAVLLFGEFAKLNDVERKEHHL